MKREFSVNSNKKHKRYGSQEIDKLSLRGSIKSKNQSIDSF